MREHLTPEALKAMMGVSEFPKPADRSALPAAVQRHYPATLRERGVTGFVLLDAMIDETGKVTEVDVLPSPDGPPHQAVLISRDRATGAETRRTLSNGTSDPAFGEAAKAALREVRFIPAMRDGQPVPFRLRMSIQFAP